MFRLVSYIDRLFLQVLHKVAVADAKISHLRISTCTKPPIKILEVQLRRSYSEILIGSCSESRIRAFAAKPRLS